MSRIVLIRHESDPDDDRIVTFLRSKGIEPQILRPFLGDILGIVDSSVIASVVYGGSFNAYDEDKHQFLYAENDWIGECMKRDIPLLGICQGAQSIAHVLGAYAGPLPGNEHEFGYYPITATDAGKNYFPEQMVVAESHFHEFQVPDGGELLAYSDLFGQQAMKYGNNTFAFQFHPEVTPAGFSIWQQRNIDMYGMPGAQTREQQNILMDRYDAVQQQWFVQFQKTFFAQAIDEMSAEAKP